MVFKEDQVYIPLQIFNDIEDTVGWKLVYNKTALFNSLIISNNSDNTYYDSGSGSDTRSEQLKKFNYNELCFNLDINYGLKEIHNISDFDTLFKNTGLVEKLKNGSATDFYDGIKELVYFYFGDLHSEMRHPSYYAGKDYTFEPAYKNPAVANWYSTVYAFRNLRNEVFQRKSYTDIKICDYAGYEYTCDYHEYDNSAYITFDLLTQQKSDYFALTSNGSNLLSYNDVKDFMGLVIYAHQQIKNNPAIKNVVIDLSCNTGGITYGMSYICSWLVGECTWNLKNALTGGMSSSTFIADVNLDGTFDKTDTLTGLTDDEGKERKFNIFCVISPVSFSCGNTLPAYLREKNNVTIIGKKSAGGSCYVYETCSADGTTFCISSNRQTSIVKNGSFYNIDEGIDPDIAITNFENVYDRDRLTDLINNTFLKQ